VSGDLPRFRTVILDVDSTLSGIEGVDWLAARRSAAVAATVQAQTEAAMQGRIPLEQVYGARLAAIAPLRADLVALADAYQAALAPEAAAVIAAGQRAGLRWIIVSGGLRTAILPLAAHVGIPASDVHAVDVLGSAGGNYVGFDTDSPLARAGGKPALLRALGPLPGPVLAVGDGSTDAELAAVVDAFWAFTGFVARPAVIAAAARSVGSFRELGEALGLSE
jgi:phosphoserine phosphatase